LPANARYRILPCIDRRWDRFRATKSVDEPVGGSGIDAILLVKKHVRLGEPDEDLQYRTSSVRRFPTIVGSIPDVVSARVGKPTQPSAHSCDAFLDDAAINVGKAEIAAGIAKGQLLMVEAKRAQDGGV
jgi:hypothetical protein